MVFELLTPTLTVDIITDTINVTGQITGKDLTLNALNIDDHIANTNPKIFTQFTDDQFSDLNNLGFNLTGTGQLTDNTGNDPLRGIVFMALALDGIGTDDRYGVTIKGNAISRMVVDPADGSGAFNTTAFYDTPFTFKWDCNADFVDSDECSLTIRNADTDIILFQRAIGRSQSNTGQGTKLFGVQSGSSTGDHRYSKWAGWVVTLKS